jgi:uncharacterized protein
VTLIDHHCHAIMLADLDRPAFESLLNEAAAPSPIGTTFFDSMLGLAIRRWCAPALHLEPHASAEEYLARRQELGIEASRRLMSASGVTAFLLDTGIRDDRLCTPAELAGLSAGRTYEVIRLETLAEDLLASGGSAQDLPDRVVRALESSEAVAAKSVAAYRVGLDLPAHPPSDTDLAAALAGLRPAADGRWRIAEPVVNGWLAWTAIEVGLPLQIHVGYGDADLDLHRADPLRLTPFLRATERRGVPVMLLHNYPFHRSAGYLAQVFAHVFCDVGLAVHNTGAFSRMIIRELLELAPFGKVLFSTDAYGLAELYLLGSLLFQRGLSTVLGELIMAGELTRTDADRITTMINSANARRAYRL